jgi:hypothetical protein
MEPSWPTIRDPCGRAGRAGHCRADIHFPGQTGGDAPRQVVDVNANIYSPFSQPGRGRRPKQPHMADLVHQAGFCAAASRNAPTAHSDLGSTRSISLFGVSQEQRILHCLMGIERGRLSQITVLNIFLVLRLFLRTSLYSSKGDYPSMRRHKQAYCTNEDFCKSLWLWV